MSTSTAEGLALADVTTAELATDAASIEIAHLVAPRARARGRGEGELAAVRPLLVAWGWRGALPASCVAATEGALVFDCEARSGAGGPTRRLTGTIAITSKRGSRSAEVTVTIAATGLVVTSTWSDGRARTRRFDGTTTLTQEADGALRVTRDLVARTDVVREYGSMAAERVSHAELTFRPDADVPTDDAARGRVSVTRTVAIRIVAPDAVRDRTTAQTTEVPLHWDRACLAASAKHVLSSGFDEGTVVFRTDGAGAEARVMRLVFAGCGPGAATLDGEAAALGESGDLDESAEAPGADVGSDPSGEAAKPSQPVQAIDSD